MELSEVFTRMLVKLLVIALPLALTACATGTVYLNTIPEKADVYLVPLKGGQAQLLGQTPLTLKAAQMEQANGMSGPFMLSLRKDRFAEFRTLITEVPPSELTIQTELTALSGLEDQDHMNEMFDLVFNAQQLALSGRYDEALAKVKTVQKEAPQIASAYEIEGGIYFLQKKLPEALDAYRIAAKYNPKNAETVRMRNLLETRLGTLNLGKAGRAQ